MTKLFKIYLGLNNPETDIEFCQFDVIREINEIFDCATIYVASGLWQGKKETSLVIEILEDINFTYARIRNIIIHLKKLYNQNTILLTRQEIDCEFI